MRGRVNTTARRSVSFMHTADSLVVVPKSCVRRIVNAVWERAYVLWRKYTTTEVIRQLVKNHFINIFALSLVLMSA